MFLVLTACCLTIYYSLLYILTSTHIILLQMKKLRALREFWTEDDPDIRTGSRKMLLLSLTEIYKDILPDYNIR